MFYPHSKKRLVAATAFTLLPIYTTAVAAPQDQNASPSKTVSLTMLQSRTFAMALSTISNKTHLTFVCEGQPLHLQLSKEEAKKANLAALEMGVPIDEAVNAIAGAYDYDVAPIDRIHPTIYLLSKRYSDPNEIPLLTFEEVKNAFQQMERATSHFTSKIGTPFAIRRLWNSLSPEQRVEARKGIRVAALSKDQQDAAFDIACDMTFWTRSRLITVAGRLKGCNKPNAQFLRVHMWGDAIDHGLRLPAYEGYFEDDHEKTVIALGSWLQTSLQGTTLIHRFPEIQFGDSAQKTGKVLNPQDEPTIPRRISAVMSDITIAKSLRQIADEITKRLTVTDQEFKTVTVATGIEEKPVFIAGDKYSSPVDLAKACAEVYALPIRYSSENKTVRILLPMAGPLTDGSKIGATVQGLIPAPFKAVVRSAIARETEPSGLLSPALQKPYTATVRRLREIIEIAMEKNGTDRLAMSVAGNEAKNLVAISNLLMCGDYLKDFSKVAPSYVSRFDTDLVSLVPAGKSGEIELINFKIGQGDKDGNSVFAGVTGLPPARIPDPR